MTDMPDSATAAANAAAPAAPAAAAAGYATKRKRTCRTRHCRLTVQRPHWPMRLSFGYLNQMLYRTTGLAGKLRLRRPPTCGSAPRQEYEVHRSANESC